MTKSRKTLRTVLTVLLTLAALLAVGSFALPGVRVALLNYWLRTTGRDEAPAVELPAEAADTLFTAELPEDLVLEHLDSDGVVFAHAEYFSPELGEARHIMLMLAYGTPSASIDTEDLLVYEEMTLGGRDVIYEEKEIDGIVYCSAFITNTEPQCFVTLNAQGVTREELLRVAETLEIFPIS